MERKKRLMKAKRIKNIKNVLLMSVIILIVIFAGVFSTKITNNLDKSHRETTQVVKQDKIFDKTKELSLVMVGDNLLHMPLINNAKKDDGSYNFDSLYEEMLPYFKDADLSVIVQETILGGGDLGYSGYPLFNSPQEVGDSLVNAGFDIILSATNHALDKGTKGIENTLNFWKKYPDITVLGINETQEQYDTIKYLEKNGINLALLNYTDSTNGIPSPKSKEYIINRAYKEKIKSDLIIAEENADFTIVFMHWGTEYRFSADESQKELAKFMTENGADLIIGSHPHVIEPAEWVQAENGKKSLVFYSLGNYVSRQKEAANLVGAMASVKICSSNKDGTYIDSSSVMPTVTHYNVNSRGFRVYPLKDYTDELASKHGVSQYDGAVSVERFKKIFYNIFNETSPVTIIE